MNTKQTGSDFRTMRGRWTARNSVALALLAIFLSAFPAGAVTVSFQEGTGGYSGTQDTFLQADPANANADNSAAAAVGWDGDDPNGTGFDVYALIRFDGIIGGGAGQVPAASQITSATLYLNVFDVGDDGQVHEALITWADTATFNSFCGGACDEGVEHGPLAATVSSGTATEVAVNVTASVQAWADGTSNFGWMIRPPEGGVGGVDVRSSEFGTVGQRPRLEVVYDEGPPVVGNLIREPYLTLATPTSQVICWRSDVTSDSEVNYGTVQGAPDLSKSDAAIVTDHCVELSPLTPATQYFYNVGSTTAVQGGGTATHYFVTPPIVGSTTPFTFWAVGDGGNGTPDQITVMNAMLAEQGASPDLALYLGDIAYNSGTDEEFTDNYFAPYDPVVRNTVVWPTLGNHEGISTTSGEPGPSTGPYYESFVLPTAAEAGGDSSGTEAYYSFDYGNTHFISLNSHNVSRSATGPMANWLVSDLANTTQQWVVAFWHHPPYSFGTHNSNTEGQLVDMRENLLPILEAGGVDLVLTGHSHNYERSYLIDGTYGYGSSPNFPTPSFATLQANGNILDDGDGMLTGDGPYLKSPGPNNHEGAVYVVAGHGGQSVSGSGTHPVMFFRESFKGSCLIDVDANTMTLRNVRMDGAISDTFTIQKGDLPPRITTVVPARDAVLSTLPQVSVTFSTAVSNVDAADLTVNGSAATSLSGTADTAGPYVFSGFTAPTDGPVSVVMAPDGIVDTTNPALLFAGDSWSYTIDTTPPAVASESPARGSTIGSLPNVTVNFTKPVVNVTPDDLLVNGSAATSLSGIDGTAGPFVFSGYADPPEGLVTVDLLQDGIEDDQALLFAGDSWTYERVARLTINEFLASNDTAAQDENGEFDDYLEIYNPSNATIDMSGMHLTDSTTPNLYEIPAGVTIGPKQFLVFWCDSQSAQGPLHTNFNLARAGERIGLYDTAANGFAEIESFAYTTQTTDISSGRFPDGAAGFQVMPPTPGAANVIDCIDANDCTSLITDCTVGACVAGECVAQPSNEGGGCDDGVTCTVSETCTAGVCGGGTDDCPMGEICNIVLDICEVGTAPLAGDLIISGFNPSDAAAPNQGEWIELFNTTSQTISLENLDIITRLDIGTPNDTLELEWQLSAVAGINLTGLSIAPHSFFLVGENGAPSPDLGVGANTMDLATGEGGRTERAISIELLVDTVHMDYVLYGRHDGSDSTAVPPGDLAFDGTTFPRLEVVRETDPAGLSFAEGLLQRVSQADLYAGHAIEGLYVDETSLGDGFPDGVWSSSTQGETVVPRNSGDAPVLPPAVVCTGDPECDDGLFCTGVETCVATVCQPGTPVDCGDGVGCTVDVCNEGTDSCDNTPDDGACDDSNVCTDDTCDGVSDCQNVNNTLPCEDGDLCTESDICGGGACISGPPATCIDGIDCTDDSCEIASGCVYTDNCPGGTVCNLGLDICEAPPLAPPLPILEGDDWRYFRGTAEPTPGDLTAWTATGFDDSLWEGPAPSGFGYGDGDDATLLDATNPPAMLNNYVSLYIRVLFDVPNPALVDSLELIVDYDDAFVCYLNGTEVDRSSNIVGTPPTFGATASPDHEASGGSPAGAVQVSSPDPGLLVIGPNALACQGHNVSAGSSDFSLIPTLTATETPPCILDTDCDDLNECTDDTCNTGTGECVFTPNDLNVCTDGNTCTDDACSAGVCVSTPNDGNFCTDSVDCTDDACSSGTCLSTDNCTGGDVCNVGSGNCETPTSLQPGDVIISGFQPSNPAGVDEWIELFNTTTSAIALDNLELIVRIDADPADGIVAIDWELPPNLLNGATIPAQGFFLMRENAAGSPVGDLTTALDLATGEGATRAISIELLIDATHMDYVLYGREDLEPGATADVPPGDLAFDGTTFPRAEVVRNCGGLGAGQACAASGSYGEGSTKRLSDVDLYAGHDVDGRYTDEATLGDGYVPGVWTSDHEVPPLTDPRNSSSATVPPPAGTPCTFDSECDDNNACNGLETCNIGIGFCQNGTPLVCDDGDVCTDDSCDPIAGCQNTNNTAPCDDANACTSGDVCGAGVCLGSPISCDDSLSCTDDSCDTGLGCQNVDNCPVGQTCNAGTDTCDAAPIIVTFQDGVAGYSGTQDALLMGSEPALTHGTLADICPGTASGPCDNFEWDLEDPAPNVNYGLVRFDDIVGGGAGQVPAGATVVSASLTIVAYDPSVAPPADLHPVLVDWDEATVTTDNFGGDAGVQVDEYGPDIADGPIDNGAAVIDVTSAVQDWVDNPASNFGLIFVPQSANGVVVRSSEYATVSERPLLTVEYEGAGAQAEMSCALSSPTVGPGGSVDLEVFLENLGDLPDVRLYQTQIQIQLTSGSGSVSVPCPGGVFIDEARSDYIFFGEPGVGATPTCPLQRASASLPSGQSTTVGPGLEYLSEYTLEVALGTTEGTTFEISFVASPGSRLADVNIGELPLSYGPSCTLTVEGCGQDSDCDDSNPCTDDACNAGSCENTPVDCSAFGDQCNDGVCNPGTGACETQAANEGLGCDDLDACTVGDVCTAGTCAGPPLNCDDSSGCTNDACVAGSCVYTPSGVCSVSGNVIYYRDHLAEIEPSTKPVPNVDIDVDSDLILDATTGLLGDYSAVSAGSVDVSALPKLGVGGASDANGGVSPFDATFIGQESVGLITLSANQLVAGDVSGNGSISAFDAALVLQFSVLLIDHFPLTTTTLSDWGFLRCDNYVDAGNQDCGAPTYSHDPLLGSEVDDFHAILYGDVTGNWQPAAGPAPPAAAEDELRALADARAKAEQIRDLASVDRLNLLTELPNGQLRPGTSFELRGTTDEVTDGVRRRTFTLDVNQGDGIQGLDLELRLSDRNVKVVDVQTGPLASDFNLLSKDLGETHRIGLYNALPMRGTGTVISITVEMGKTAGNGTPFKLIARANEQNVPVRVADGGSGSELALSSRE
jgi:hypothetical protein